MKDNGQPISKQTLKRLPMYLNFLRSLPQDTTDHASATSIAEGLGLNQVQVRKDLAMVSDGGKPKTGYVINELIADIEDFLGYGNVNSAVILGAGHLGQALLSYEGFKRYGLEIVTAFDTDPAVIGKTVSGKTVLSVEKLADISRRLQIHIGIITVPAAHAQEAADHLVAAGVQAIWNFAPTMLKVPAEIIVQNENMAASLAVLSNHLREQQRERDI